MGCQGATYLSEQYIRRGPTRAGRAIMDGETGSIELDLWVYPLKWGETVADQDWFPLHFHSLLGSQFVAEACVGGESSRAGAFTAVLLWCEAFKQDPAGTLPDNDVALARFAGFGPDIEAWRKVKDLALRGWCSCHIDGDERRSQGRLGHRVVAEQAVYAWNRKNGRKLGRDAARLSNVKWKVRQQLEKSKRPARLINDDMLITRLAEWLIQSGLHVTAENVASGLAAAGVPSVISMVRNGDDQVR